MLMLALSFSYAAVCCYNPIDNEVQIATQSSCNAVGYITLGDSDLSNDILSFDSGDLNSGFIAPECEQLVVNDGLNCKLGNGNYKSSTFYLKIGANNYPQDILCADYEPCLLGTCTWINGGGGGGVTPTPPVVSPEDPSDTLPIIPGLPPGDVVDGDTGLTPFVPVANNLCNSFDTLSGVLLSKSSCEAITVDTTQDCVYDPKRLGVMQDLEGDSMNTGIFSSLKADEMCVSKFNSIQSCEDINSQYLCSNYDTLGASADSLIGIYGCEWREFNTVGGQCVTKDLYFESNDRLNNGEFTSIDIRKSLIRKNIVENPIFEYDFSSSNWNSFNALKLSTSRYSHLFGQDFVRLSTSGYISQLVSGIGADIEYELVIHTTNDYTDFAVEFGDDVVLFSNIEYNDYVENYTSSMRIISYDLQGSLEDSSKEIKIINIIGSSVDIYAVSLHRKSVNVVADATDNINRYVYPEEEFSNGAFDCSICTIDSSLGICDQSPINEYNNCALISSSTQELYSLENFYGSLGYDDNQKKVNPYTTDLGIENMYIQEDMTFCGLYTDQTSCENPNSYLNSNIKELHPELEGTSNTLCKWHDFATLPNGGICFKDSSSNNYPDTTNSGVLDLKLIDIQPEFYFYDHFTYEFDSNRFNDFQRSCDSLPPRVYIELYRKAYDINGDVQITTYRNNPAIDGVLDLVFVRIEEYQSQACEIYPNFNSGIELIIENPTLGISEIIDSRNLFEDYNSENIFEKVYTRDEIESKINGLGISGLTLETLFSQGTSITPVDLSGNVGINDQYNFQFMDDVDFDLKYTPDGQDFFSHTILRIENDVSLQDSETCLISVNGLDNGLEYYSNSSVEVSTLKGGFNLGEILSNRIGEDDQRIRILVEAFCENQLGSKKLKSINAYYSTNDFVLVIEPGTTTPMDPLLNSRDTTFDLDFYSKENTCTQISYGGVDYPITMTALVYALNPEYEYNYNQEIDVSTLSDGEYNLTIGCVDENSLPFENNIAFEVDNQIPQVDKIHLMHEDDSKWLLNGGIVHIDSRDSISDASNVGTLINILNSNMLLNVSFAISGEDVSKVIICGVENDDIIEIGDKHIVLDLRNFDLNSLSIDPEICSVDDNGQSIEFLSDIIVEDNSGNQYVEDNLLTLFDFNSPTLEINYNGIQIDTTQDRIFVNNNNPSFTLSLNTDDREFSCNIRADKLDGSFFETSLDSVNKEIIFDGNSFGVVGNPFVSYPVELLFECRESLFSEVFVYNANVYYDNEPPIIDSIEFVALGDNWRVLESGIQEIHSRVEIKLANTEEAISCNYWIDQYNGDTNTASFSNFNVMRTSLGNIVIDSNPLIIGMFRNDRTTPALIDIDPFHFGLNPVEFEIGVLCVDGAGNTDSYSKSGYDIYILSPNQLDISLIGMNSDKTIDLLVESGLDINDATLTIRNADSDVVLSGRIDSFSNDIVSYRNFYETTIKNLDLNLGDLESQFGVEFEVEIETGSGLKVVNVITLDIDNSAPIIQINSPSNGIILYDDELYLDVHVEDLNYTTDGIIELLEFRIIKDGALVNITSINASSNVYSNNYFPIINLDIPANYQIEIVAQDSYSNINSTIFTFNTSNDYSITLLNSSNAYVSIINGLTWYTTSQDPILKFEYQKPNVDCRLKQGSSFITSAQMFSRSGNEFTLDTSTIDGFAVPDGKRQFIIQCSDDFLIGDIQEFKTISLFGGIQIPDYVLSVDSGDSHVLLNLDGVSISKEINYTLNLRTSLNDVSCNILLNGNKMTQNEWSFDHKTLKGSFGELLPGNYDVTYSCETPNRISGSTKIYSFEIIEEEFDLEIKSLGYDLPAQKYSVENLVEPYLISIPSGFGNVSYDIELETNYAHDNLYCDIKVAQSIITEFLSDWFNLGSYVNMVKESDNTFSANINLDENSRAIYLRCTHDAISLSSQIFKFELESFVNDGSYDLTLESVTREDE